jgi:hypothetical protein
VCEASNLGTLVGRESESEVVVTVVGAAVGIAVDDMVGD